MVYKVSDKNKGVELDLSDPGQFMQIPRQPQREVDAFNFGHRTRFVVLVLATLCLTLTYSNSLSLNFTVICMSDVSDAYYGQQSSNETAPVHWLESPGHKNALFSAIAVGTILGTLPLMTLMRTLGAKKTFFLYGALSAFSTLAFPAAVDLGGFLAALFIRVLQGSALAFNFPATGSICAQWSTLAQSGLYIAILSTHLQFSAIFTMPVAGVICESALGWRSLYYLQGVLSVGAFIVFYWFYEENPASHRKVSAKELTAIQQGKDTLTGGPQQVPYKAICMHKVIVGVWISAIGGHLGFNLFFQFGPIYINKVLGLEVTSTGFATALPFVLSAVVKFIAGPLSDNTNCIGETGKIILFTSLSQGFMATCFVGLAYVNDAFWAQVLYTAAIVCSGLNIVGMIKCAQLVSRQHIHFVMAVMSICNCLIVFFIPGVVAFVAPDNTKEQWDILLYLTAAVVVVTNVYFLFVADSEAAPWTKSDYGSSTKSYAVATDAPSVEQQTTEELSEVKVEKGQSS